MDFRILGPLEVIDEGRALEVGGRRQRALLALLLLHCNEVVSSERLAEELWDGAPPEEAARTLQVTLSRLRKALEPGRPPGEPSRLIETRPPGYRLTLEPGRLDLHRFESLLSEGQAARKAGEPQLAAERLREALSIWRGEPLADLAYESFAQAETARLSELRLRALGREELPRRELEVLAADDFAALHLGSEWFFSASLLAEVCGVLGDPDRAGRLYELMAPYGAYNVISQPEVSLGSASRYLGILAATLARWDDAERHFEAAVEMNRRMGPARGWPTRKQTMPACCEPAGGSATSSGRRR